MAEPLSAYGAQKVAVEEFVQGLQAGGAPITTLVVSGVYGPVSPHLDGSFAALTGALAAGMVAPDSGLGVVDVRESPPWWRAAWRRVGAPAVPGDRQLRDLGAVDGGPERGGGPHRALHRCVGRGHDRTRRAKFDELRDGGAEGLPPLSVEAAVVMASGRPADDSATVRDLGVTYRPTVETFRDTLDWLRAAGLLDLR